MKYFSSHHDAIHPFHTLERLVERLSGQFTRRLFTMPGASTANSSDAPVRSSTRNRLLSGGMLAIFFQYRDLLRGVSESCFILRCLLHVAWLADYQQFISSRFWSTSFYFLPYPPFHQQNFRTMAETFETGHAVNAANFNSLVDYATTWGAAYKPPKDDLKLGSLQALNTQVQSAIKSLAQLEGSAIEPQQQRTQLADQLDDKARGIISTMKVLGLNASLLDRAKTVSDLITGSNVTKMSQKRKQEAELAKAAGQVPSKGNSVSQQSLVKRLDNFADLLSMVTGFSEYTPNADDEYAIAHLTAFLATVNKASNDADKAEAPLTKARAQRNTFLYDETTGAVAIAARVKEEIARTLKKTSPEYKQLSALKFKKVKQ